MLACFVHSVPPLCVPYCVSVYVAISWQPATGQQAATLATPVVTENSRNNVNTPTFAGQEFVTYKHTHCPTDETSHMTQCGSILCVLQVIKHCNIVWPNIYVVLSPYSLFIINCKEG